MKQKVFSTLGATSHARGDRETHDFYRTDPIAATVLIDVLGNSLPQNIWECACGDGALSQVFINKGYQVLSTDLIDRGFGTGGIDFLTTNQRFDGGAIITNPPFKYASEFVVTALNKISDGDLACLFLRTLFLEGKMRKKLFEQHPPKYVYVSSGRITCKKPNYTGNQSAMSFSWFVWQKGHQGDTVVRWFDVGDYKNV